MATTSRSTVHGRLRWYMISYVFAGLVINYLDRASLGVALPFMGETFHLSKTEEGMILAAFFWSYDFFQLAVNGSSTGTGRAGRSPSPPCGGRCSPR